MKINRFLIERTDQRSRDMNKKYLVTLRIPIFLIFCVLIPTLTWFLTNGSEDQLILVVSTFIISVLTAIITFYLILDDARYVFDEMLTYSIVEEISERKVIFDRIVDDDQEMLYVDMFVNHNQGYFSTNNFVDRSRLLDRISRSKYADLRINTKGSILSSKRVYFGKQIIEDSEIPDKFLKDQIETIELYEAEIEVKIGMNRFADTVNVIDIKWSIVDEKDSELNYRIAEEAKERLKL